MSAASERRDAARRGAELVERGLRVGLGSGRTVALLIEELGRRKLRFTCACASRESERLARRAGLTVVPLAAGGLDLALDGADEVDPKRRLLKGGGGAMTRERILLAAATRRVILVDRAKLVPRLGTRAKLPIEILPFGAARAHALVEKVVGRAQLRQRERRTFVTDNGGWILDAPLGSGNLAKLEATLRALPGVIDCGLFLDLDAEIVVGTE